MKSLSYKGFLGSIETSLEDNCLYGKVEFITDLITYEAETVKELKKAFEAAVDSYIELCEELGQEPEKQFKGSFNVRLGPELHREAALYAKSKGLKLNEFVCDAAKQALQKKENNEVHYHHHSHIESTESISIPNYDDIYKELGGTEGWVVPRQKL